MAGLTLADDLTLANERIAEIEEELAGLKDDGARPEAKDRDNGARFRRRKIRRHLLESAARRMEDIAARLG